MNNRNNKNGFTLVELLAVIVVLAIVMVIAVGAVLPQMQEGRQNIFAIEANGAIDSAQTYLMNNTLAGKGNKRMPVGTAAVCVTIDELVNAGVSDLDKDTYKGRVVVKKVGNIYVYSVSLNNGALMVTNEGFTGSGDNTVNKNVEGYEVVDFDTTKFSSRSGCTDNMNFFDENKDSDANLSE